ncbi:MAG TPA: hypothetical protein VKZ48_01120 [Burkholderiales bacterium]|nr:hypothetical protein [Burkholderiales bacterium]
MRLFLLLALCLHAAPVAADEKVQNAEGVVAPSGQAGEQAERSAARKADADWIKRCDKLAPEARMRCLEDVRAQMVRRVEAQAPDAARPE